MLTLDDLREATGLVACYQKLRKVKPDWAQNQADLEAMHPIAKRLIELGVEVPHAD